MADDDIEPISEYERVADFGVPLFDAIVKLRQAVLDHRGSLPLAYEEARSVVDALKVSMSFKEKGEEMAVAIAAVLTDVGRPGGEARIARMSRAYFAWREVWKGDGR